MGHEHLGREGQNGGVGPQEKTTDLHRHSLHAVPAVRKIDRLLGYFDFGGGLGLRHLLECFDDDGTEGLACLLGHSEPILSQRLLVVIRIYVT